MLSQGLLDEVVAHRGEREGECHGQGHHEPRASVCAEPSSAILASPHVAVASTSTGQCQRYHA